VQWTNTAYYSIYEQFGDERFNEVKPRDYLLLDHNRNVIIVLWSQGVLPIVEAESFRFDTQPRPGYTVSRSSVHCTSFINF
jgi:hypothetical protein